MNFNHQNSTLGEKVSSLICALFAIGLLGWCVMDFVAIATKGGSQMMIFASALLAFAKGIAGIILVAPSLTRWALGPAFRCIDWIYSPGGYNRRPPLDYRLAELYRRERKFDEALERYSEIVRYYPREVSAHAWRYVILDQTSQRRKARAAQRRARRCLRTPGAFEQFLQMISERESEWH